MLIYIIFVVVLLFLFEFFYIKIVSFKRNISNQTSKSKISGAGIVFIPAIFIHVLFFYRQIDFSSICFIGAIFIVTTISFIDDLRPISPQIRLITQFIAVTVVFVSYGYLGDFSIAKFFLILVGYVLTIGYTNIYNFMDGINGMIVLNALCCYITFYLINTYLIQFTNSNLIMVLIIATIVFGYYNFRKKPKCFAGDAGSITMGFTIVFFTLKLFIVTKNISVFLMLGVYSLDGGWTILERLYRKENIFKVHLRHLYELLANQFKIPHLIISTAYALLQVILNILVYLSIKNDYNTITSFVIISICLSLIYIFTKKAIYKRIKLK